MRVEHFDSELHVSSLLEDDVPSKSASPAMQYGYWLHQYEYLKRAYENMPRTKERQQVALLRDQAQRARNHYRGMLSDRDKAGSLDETS